MQFLGPTFADAAPSTYPEGLSTAEAATTLGWPLWGTVLTVKHSGGRMQQTVTSTDSSLNYPAEVYVRYGHNTAHDGTDDWSAWTRLGQPKLYDTGDNSERVTSLPVPTKATVAHRRVIYSQYLPNLKEGELIQFMSEVQVTNDLGYNCMCVLLVIQADSATATVGTELTEANGRNVTPNTHHDVYPKHGAVKITNTSRPYVNVVAYAASTAAKSGHTLKVDQDYGRLTILRY